MQPDHYKLSNAITRYTCATLANLASLLVEVRRPSYLRQFFLSLSSVQRADKRSAIISKREKLLRRFQLFFLLLFLRIDSSWIRVRWLFEIVDKMFVLKFVSIAIVFRVEGMRPIFLVAECYTASTFQDILFFRNSNIERMEWIRSVRSFFPFFYGKHLKKKKIKNNSASPQETTSEIDFEKFYFPLVLPRFEKDSIEGFTNDPWLIRLIKDAILTTKGFVIYIKREVGFSSFPGNERVFFYYNVSQKRRRRKKRKNEGGSNGRRIVAPPTSRPVINTEKGLTKDTRCEQK